MQYHRLTIRTIMILGLLSLAACGGGGGGGVSEPPNPTSIPPEASPPPSPTPNPSTTPTTEPLAAPALEAIDNLALTSDSPITPLVFANNGGAELTACTADALPAGLEVSVSDDATTCEISGVPAQSQDATAHTITATNATGSSSVDVTIEVAIALPSLVDIQYQRFVLNEIVSISIQNDGGGELIDCAADTLPQGLELTVSEDAKTCQINGDAILVEATATYTITATNASGSSDTSAAIEVSEPLPFITTWQTNAPGSTSESREITIHTNPQFPYNYNVDWGDNTANSNLTGDSTHIYDEPGVYTVTISGVFPQPYSPLIEEDEEGEEGDSGFESAKLLTIEQWGDRVWRSMERAFAGAENLAAINDENAPNLSRVSSMKNMFQGASLFNSPIDHWDVANVTDMSGMFEQAAAFDQDIGSWDVSSVTNMDLMFAGAKLSIVNYSALLVNWSALPLQPAVQFDAGESQFSSDAAAAKQILTDTDGLAWEIQDDGLLSVPELSREALLEYVGLPTSVAIENTGGDIDECQSQDVPQGLTVNVAEDKSSCVISGEPDFRQESTPVIVTAKNELGESTVEINLEIIDPSDFVTIWRAEAPTGDQTITITTSADFEYNFKVDWGDGTTSDNVTGDITHTYENPAPEQGYEVVISGNYPAPFFNCSQQSAGNLQMVSVQTWSQRPWLSMREAFRNCDELAINDPFNPDFSRVTNMSNMFRGASFVEGTDISGWDVSNVTAMSAMFRFFNFTNFTSNINNWDVSNVTTMDNMFRDSNFDGDISGWDVSNVTNMLVMFLNAESFNSDIGNWNVSNVRNMRGMFNNAQSFNQDIGGWDVSNVTNMFRMFRLAENFNQNINNWDVSRVTDMAEMFRQAVNFDQPLDQWNVSNVINMAGMFELADDFNRDIGSWNITNVSDMQNMFTGSLSTANYDELLLGWSKLDLTVIGQDADFIVDVGNTQFSPASQGARNILTNTFGWTINDGGSNAD